MSVVKFMSYVLSGLLLLYLVRPGAAEEGDGRVVKEGMRVTDWWNYPVQGGASNQTESSDNDSMCNTGQHQSPVDIRNTKHTHLPPLNFQYRTSILSINREGGNLWIDYDSGSYLYIRGKRYKLIGFDFHTPGEHRFNGEAAEMEIHLHHIDAEGQRLIVAIPVVGGHRNNITLMRIWENIPNYNSLREYRRIGINPMFLLPLDRSYALYSGSETKPPCEEDVLWIVFTNPIRVSNRDIGRFHSIVGNNARPVQPLNNRVIVQSNP